MVIHNRFELPPEVTALNAVTAAVARLEPEQRIRVLQSALQLFGVNAQLPSAPPAQQISNDAPQFRSENGTGNPSAARPAAVNIQDFPDFASFFDAAGPVTETEKSLVSAFWVSKGGEETFEGQPVNTQLKNLGHSISNITSALSALMERKPSAVLQTRKSGNSRQARKTYRLTAEGMRSVANMIKKRQSDAD